MITASNVSELADLAEASYRNFGLIPAGQILEGSALKQPLIAGSSPWPEARADEFIRHWRVVAHQPNTRGDAESGEFGAYEGYVPNASRKEGCACWA